MWEVIIPAAANLLTSSMGAGRAERSIRDAARTIANVPTPSMGELEYSPELVEYLRDLEFAQLTPTYTLGPSAFEAISLDPQLRQQQMLALQQAQQRALQGFTAQDRAALEQYLQAAAAEAQSQRKQVMEEMARRGAVDSGAALVAALQGGQNTANMLSNQALQRAALSLQQQQQANEQLSRLAAGIEQTDYSRAADLATRRDAIEQFNQQLRQRALESNVEAQRKAQLYNIEREYDIQEKRKKEQNLAKQQRAENRKWQAQFELNKALGQASPTQSAATTGLIERVGTAQSIANIGKSIYDWLSNKPSSGGGGGEASSVATNALAQLFTR